MNPKTPGILCSLLSVSGSQGGAATLFLASPPLQLKLANLRVAGLAVKESRIASLATISVLALRNARTATRLVKNSTSSWHSHREERAEHA
jgi:hypothetical protein